VRDGSRQKEAPANETGASDRQPAWDRGLGEPADLCSLATVVASPVPEHAATQRHERALSRGESPAPGLTALSVSFRTERERLQEPAQWPKKVG
jgi:hypothetical protein